MLARLAEVAKDDLEAALLHAGPWSLLHPHFAAVVECSCYRTLYRSHAIVSPDSMIQRWVQLAIQLISNNEAMVFVSISAILENQ